ncbi:MAG: cation transporter [Runella sp.]
MQKTIFKISKMDCPSEEQMIRMALAPLSQIKSLAFDIPNRQLTVFHTESHEAIFEKLKSLQLDTSLIDSQKSDELTTSNHDTASQRTLLWQVLSINFFFFLLESSTGLVSKSMGLVADSLDMLADSIVYGLALWAVGGTVARQKNIAKAAGYFQLALAILGFVEVIRRFFGLEVSPHYPTMIVISFLALLGNALCLYLLQKTKSQEAHIQASMIFTSNDVIINLGVIVAGGLVYVTHSQYPDLIVGSIVFVLVFKESFRILQLAK